MWDVNVDLEKHGLAYEDIAQPRLYYKSDYEELGRMAAEVENDQGISFPDSPLRIFGDAPLTYTRCLEGDVVFGGFDPAGPIANNRNRHGHYCRGSGGQWKFEGDRY